MISNKTNRRRRVSVAAMSGTVWRGASPTSAGETTQLVRYLVLRLDRTTTDELVAMQYRADDLMDAVENARLLADEAAGAVAFWSGDEPARSP